MIQVQQCFQQTKQKTDSQCACVCVCVCVCVQEKKGQELPKGPEVEEAKMEKLLSLLREPDYNSS